MHRHHACPGRGGDHGDALGARAVQVVIATVTKIVMNVNRSYTDNKSIEVHLNGQPVWKSNRLVYSSQTQQTTMNNTKISTISSNHLLLDSVARPSLIHWPQYTEYIENMLKEVKNGR